jgi:hypothetical protein
MAKGDIRDDASGFSDEALAELHQLLTQAQSEAAPDADSARRVAFIAQGAAWTEIETRAHRLLSAAAKPDPAEVRRVLDERYHFMRDIFQNAPNALNVTNISWGEDAGWGKLNYRFPDSP